MAVKRKAVKKNIKRDPLVTQALKLSQYAQEHFNQIIIGVAALVIIIAAVVFTTNNRRNAAYRAERQLSQALSLYQQGDYEAAKTAFTQIVNDGGGHYKAISMYYKAECELTQQNYSQALLDYEQYRVESSDFPQFKIAALYGVAICQESLQNYAAAATAMEEIHRLCDENDPRWLDSAFKAGELFAKTGNYELARKYFQDVVDNASGPLKDKAAVSITLLAEL